MRTNIDFAPFNRFGVGFDRIFNLLENAELTGNGPKPAADIHTHIVATALADAP